MGRVVRVNTMELGRGLRIISAFGRLVGPGLSGGLSAEFISLANVAQRRVSRCNVPFSHTVTSFAE